MFLSVHQVAEALLMLQCGIVIGFVYNLFAPLRNLGGGRPVVVFFADLLFCITAGVVAIVFLLIASEGVVHFYSFLCVAMGILLQYLSMRPIIMAVRRRRAQKQKLKEQADEERSQET